MNDTTVWCASTDRPSMPEELGMRSIDDGDVTSHFIIIIDASNKCADADYNSGTVSRYAIDMDGGLSPVSSVTVGAMTNSGSISRCLGELSPTLFMGPMNRW